MVTDVSIQMAIPVSNIMPLEKAKKQLRLEADFTDEDDLIQDYVLAAIEQAEAYINGHINAKTMVITLDAFQPNVIFEAYPVRNIKSVTYWQDDEQKTMPTTDYYTTRQNIKQSKLWFKEQPNTDKRPDAVAITLSVGYETANEVPQSIKQAILLMVSDMYERREDRAETITTAAQAKMRPFRKYT